MDYFLTNFKGFWDIANRSKTLRRWFSKWAINRAIRMGPFRPHPLSLKSDYTSWDSLTDRTYTGRHLPPVQWPPEELPAIEAVRQLFAYRNGEWQQSVKSTLLFSYFAQWFTDGFLRTDRNDRRKNTSNHDIDLSPLYGLNADQTEVLRSWLGGRLDSQEIHGEEYPPYLYEHGIQNQQYTILETVIADWVSQERRETLFAMGGDRANVTIGYAMFNILFLREHNRICGELHTANPGWDDERLFQTARNVLIVTLVKLVIEEYINHITPEHFNLIADPLAFTNEPWYRQNWMTVEFNLLYRWHSLTPPLIQYDGMYIDSRDAMFHNDLITSRGLGILMEEASNQPSGEIGLHNTMDFLIERAEMPTLEQAREARLASYNDYRELCQLPRVTDFDQITRDADLQQELEDIYENVDNIEFYTGLLAEDTKINGVLPELMTRMVAFDAFSQALTNPLLSHRVFNEETFSPAGMDIIHSTNSLSEILQRNVPNNDIIYLVRLTQ